MNKKEKFSYSKLETYDQCPYKYNLRYNKKLYLSSDNVASQFGSLIHKINELQTIDLISGKKIDYEMLKKYFVEVNLEKKNETDREGNMFGTNVLSQKYEKDWFQEDKSGKTYEQKAREFLEKGIYRQENYLKEHPELELVGAEIPFEFSYGNYLFHGFIDRVLVYKNDKNHYVIHDLKTSARAYDDKKCTTPLQFVIYVKALKQKYGENIQVDCFYEFPVANEMKQAGTKGFEDRGMKKIDKLLLGISNQDYVPYSSPLCFWCDFCNNNPNQPEDGKNKCPYYSMWRPDAKSYATKLPWLGQEFDDMQIRKLIALDSLTNSESDEDFDI